ncbi:MAG: cation transporter [Acidimicrobiales bacterium]
MRGRLDETGKVDSEAVPSQDAQARHRHLSQALTLEYLSILWGLVSAGWSVTAGILAGSLGVLGLGLTVLADIGGSATLVWRFRRERQAPATAQQAEARASLVVAASLAVVAVFLATEAIRALATGSAAGQSISAIASAGAAAAILTPLGIAKYRLGQALHSPGLKGDGTLSGIGAALGILALVGLLAEWLVGWWWADRSAALVASLIATGEAVRVFRQRPDH